MTLDEKIELLKTAAMEDARAAGNRIIKEHSDVLNNLFEEHKEYALKQAELTLNSETNKAKQDLNKAMAKSQIDLKRAQGKCHTKLKNKLFQEVLTLLNAYMNTEAYDEFLVTHIQKALAFAKDSDMTIYIDPSDADKKAFLEERTHAALTVSKETFIGGMRAVIHDRRVLIDNSFSSLLQEEYERFLFTGGEANG